MQLRKIGKNRKANWMMENLGSIILVILVIAALVAVLYYTDAFGKLARLISPECAGSCRTGQCMDDVEYESPNSRCKTKGTICCLKYGSSVDGIDTGAGGSGAGAGSLSDPSSSCTKEGAACNVRTEVNMICDKEMRCVSKCDYCADSANTKRNDLCKAKTGNFVLNESFSCSCSETECNSLIPYNKCAKGFCSGKQYCCSSLDSEEPVLSIASAPQISPTEYYPSYIMNVTCNDPDENDAGLGCGKILYYNVLLNDRAEIMRAARCNDTSLFPYKETAIKYSDNQPQYTVQYNFNSVNATFLTKFYPGAYSTQNGFKGDIIVYFCIEDKAGHKDVEKRAFHLAVPGNETRCLKNVQPNVCTNLTVPCYDDDRILRTDPQVAGMVCLGYEYYFPSGLQECITYQNAHPMCK